MTVQKHIVDSVEFFVSADKSQVGMSQIGIARFCGVAESTMRSFISDGARRNNTSDELKSLLNKDLPLAASESGGLVKLIPAEVCVSVIEHFAFTENNETAKFAFRKFAAIGFSAWVLQITGQEEVKPLSNLEHLKQLQKGLEEMIKVEEYCVNKPGLTNMVNFAKNDALSLPSNDIPTETLLTIDDILERLGIDAARDEKKAIGMYAATAYRNLTGKKPYQLRKNMKQLNKKHQSFMVSAYPLDFVPIIENAINLGFTS